jgi:hypothetical protein
MESELKALKTITENVVQYFYLRDSEVVRRAPQAAGLTAHSVPGGDPLELSETSRLTLGILKYLYPKVDLGAANEGFAATCTEEDANELV